MCRKIPDEFAIFDNVSGQRGIEDIGLGGVPDIKSENPPGDSFFLTQPRKQFLVSKET